MATVRKTGVPPRGTGKLMQLGDAQITMQAHDRIVEHVIGRYDLAHRMRTTYIDVFKYIDNEYHTWMQRDKDDAKRQRDNVRGKSVKAVDQKLSLMFSQIDEAQTYLLSVLAPDASMYTAMAAKEKQPVAKGLATLMNRHAQQFGHYNQLAVFLLDCLKYNFGAYTVSWVDRQGNMVVNDKAGRPTVKQGSVATGNELFALDPYNTLLDPTVNPTNLAVDGEFFGYVKMETPFRLAKMEADEELFNTKDFIRTSPSAGAGSLSFYQQRNQVRNDLTGGIGNSSGPDWVAIFNQAPSTDECNPIGALETTVGYFWVIPHKLGLGKSKNYEIWRFVTGGRTHLLSARQMKNAHGLLPVNVAQPWEDHFGWQTKGATERLIPHQQFASATMNMHQRANRKRLVGLTVFDQRYVPLMNQDDVDLEGGKVPADTHGQDVDLRSKVVQFNDAPDTGDTMNNIKMTTEMMQDVLPTRMAQQVAGLERATEYQAAATVQAASRRNLRIAKIIDAQAMVPGRHMQYNNILQYQPYVEVLNTTGDIVVIDPKILRNTSVEFTIADGLRGIDKLALTIHMKDMLNAVLQSQQAAAQIDVVAFMNYISTLYGDETDITQFRTQSPMDKLPADQRTMAFQLLQQYIQQQQAAAKGGGNQAGGGAVVPMAGRA